MKLATLIYKFTNSEEPQSRLSYAKLISKHNLDGIAGDIKNSIRLLLNEEKGIYDNNCLFCGIGYNEDLPSFCSDGCSQQAKEHQPHKHSKTGEIIVYCYESKHEDLDNEPYSFNFKDGMIVCPFCETDIDFT